MARIREEKNISSDGSRLAIDEKARRGFSPLEAGAEGAHRDAVESLPTGFTLIELLVVLAITSLLMAVSLPVLGKVRCHGRTILGMSNQRQIVCAVNLFAIENDGRYPESVASIGSEPIWYWEDPKMMTACMARSPQVHRSMSAYLRSYIEDASVMFCPSAPLKYKYLQEAWDAGDDWDNPDTDPPPPPLPALDPVRGTYCFYWNYVGFLEGGRGSFKGPRGASGGRGQSRLLVSDYFGYDQVYSRNAYGSCERFEGANITQGSEVSSAYWSIGGSVRLDALKIRLHAGYTDGHVETFRPSETVRMWVSITPDGSCRNSVLGVFYLPGNAVH